MADRKIPQFQNEAEEARWWFEHRDEIGSDLISASRQGHVGEGSVARHARRMQQPKKAQPARGETSAQNSLRVKTQK